MNGYFLVSNDLQKFHRQACKQNSKSGLIDPSFID
jgi:hypothetical protein